MRGRRLGRVGPSACHLHISDQNSLPNGPRLKGTSHVK